MSLIAELQRRKVFKVGVAYLVGAWLAVQAASIGFPAFDAPPWALRIFILVAFLGFPMALLFAWVFDVTPEGVKLDAGPRGSKAIVAVAVSFVLLAFLWYFKGQPAYRDDSVPAPTASAASGQAPAAPPVAEPVRGPIDEKSIAVLPFADMSPGKDQEYFSDGMAEEILNTLVQVKELRVAGRTSSFQYKGRNESLRSIGEALGVAHVLEGSVRQQGNKVRITAQLVRTADDTHLWSQAYDGDLSDVFELQEKIARAITDQLKVVLQGEQKTRLVPVATSSPEAYLLYLQATAIFDRRDEARYDDAIAELQEAIRLDPKFARAHARLASINVVIVNRAEVDLESTHALVVKHANAASALDPTLAEPYAALGFSEGKFPGRRIAERQALERALELGPDDVTTNFWFGLSLVKCGYLERGTALIDRALSLDPMLPNALRWRGNLYLDAGDLDRAEQVLKRSRDAGLWVADRSLSELARARGDHASAIRLFTNALRFPGLPPDARGVIAAGSFGDVEARGRAVAILQAYLAAPRTYVMGLTPLLLARLDEPGLAIAVARQRLTSDNTDFLVLLWGPQGRALRALPEFPAFLRDFGFVALWDQYGAPDVCRKQGAGDYVCP